MRIAIQGEIGSFHHLAAQHWGGDNTEYVICVSFAKVFDALAAGKADQGLVAIENSLYGSINSTYDLIDKYSYPVIGEISERIHQHLVTLDGTTLADIKTVVSHPVALGQCSDFLDSKLPSAERIEYRDTAAAAQYIKKTNDPQVAAIASSTAAELAGLSVLQSNIENDPRNYTRFMVVQPGGQKPEGANKASLMLRTSHNPGALYTALGVFAEAGINLTKLQSRPIPGKVWHYRFYIDADAAGAGLHAVIGKLKNQGCDVTLLGEYIAATTEYED